MENMPKEKRVKTPTILQMEAAECGAAALAIILGYFGRYVPLDELRMACGVSRDGSKAVNMLRAARHYGLEAVGAKMEPEQLAEANFPFIAFWEFNHFVVVEGFDANKIYLNDPATGPRTVTLEEFDRAFTGVALIFAPTPEFQPAGQKPSLWRGLLPRLKGLKQPLLFILFLSIALVVPGILIPGFTKIFIDNILIGHITGWLVPLLWGIFITAIFRAVASFFQHYYLLRLQLNILLTSATQFLWHMLRLPLAFFSQRLAGDVQSRIYANDRIAAWLSGDLSTGSISLISMLFFAIIMYFYDWTLATIAIVVAAANAALLISVSRQIQNKSFQLLQEEGKLFGVEMAGLQTIETIKAVAEENDFFQRWAGYHVKTLISEQRINLYAGILAILPQLLLGLTTVAILGLGGFRIMQGYLTIGGLVAFQSLWLSFNEPIEQLLGVSTTLQQLRGDLMRLEDVNKHPEDSRFTFSAELNSTASALSDHARGKLELQQVSFGYSPLEKPILEDINILLQPGKQLAIVGASGSGKSTLIKLICGLYQPWSGGIFWNDQLLSTVSPVTFSRYIAYVDQDVFLFEGSIEENITLWNDSVSTDVIDRAVYDAGLKPILASRPDGLASKVTYAGGNFSGGQRQQIEIARALAMEPALLVLDEATAAMDSATENYVMENIRNRGCSILVAAHRLSAIRGSDEIIVVDQGKIVERGTHAELCQLQGFYTRLLNEKEKE